MTADRKCDVCGGAIYLVDASVEVIVNRGQSPTLFVYLCDQCALESMRPVIAGAIERAKS